MGKRTPYNNMHQDKHQYRISVDVTTFCSILTDSRITLWCQLEDMFQLIVTPQGNGKVTIQLIGI